MKWSVDRVDTIDNLSSDRLIVTKNVLLFVLLSTYRYRSKHKWAVEPDDKLQVLSLTVRRAAVLVAGCDMSAAGSLLQHCSTAR